MGFLVKLDTNGTRPDVLKKILDEKLVDYVAMDIKNTPQKYNQTTGVKVDIKRIKLSVELIKNQAPDYEFRTTVVPGLHTSKNILEIAKWLKGAKRYFLQSYRETKILDEKLKKKTKNKKVDLAKIKEKIVSFFEEIGIRE
jgi:pyruvate formate lyase activating enzyme